ncbi:universal stress protein [Halorientalis litorea]|jgi:nucleotide-binding universal stress UspA family protein|uniref:universal stress protein n=1 Tax=Halorientalis litorea TaxID=2931977 RepID=UPI001FF2CA1F|nr:universal stress protein [Halorientalis litorea]
MTQVVVPVRYPLSKHSRATLERAVEVARTEDADLTVLHVNLYQDNEHASRSDLKRAVEDAVGRLPNARYVVRTGLLVEETILDEVVTQRADIVVIGRKQASRWRRMVRRIADDPDIEQFLADEIDARIITVSAG